jgi:ABC-type transporter Mla maintaining outer membrane lipid asymmetry ATPase subunit MlaF
VATRDDRPIIEVRNLDMKYGDRVIQHDLNFSIHRGDIFVIMGESGLGDLILELRASLGATVVIVTHELPSIFAVATNSVFLDATTKTVIATGPPKTLLAETRDAKVREFLTRRGTEGR